jgi:uncharacterized membrane protein
MAMLSAGVLLWALVHLVPGPGRHIRQSIVTAIGEKAYKGIFSLLIIAALLLIVFGWRATIPQAVYLPPSWGGPVAIVLMATAVFLFGATHAKTRIKRVVRHPQLTSILIWSVAHLLANGDNRSLLLFGSLGIWALLEIMVVNRRDRKWHKPAAPPLATEVRGLIIAAVVFALLIYLHPYFAGVALLRT